TLLTEDVPLGGAETQTLLLSRALTLRGVRVCIVVFEAPGAEIPASVDGIDLIAHPQYDPHQPLPRQVREAVRIFNTVSRIEAGVVTTRGAGPHVGIAALAARLTGKRFVYSRASISDFRPGVISARRPYHLPVRLGHW